MICAARAQSMSHQPSIMIERVFESTTPSAGENFLHGFKIRLQPLPAIGMCDRAAPDYEPVQVI
jgi:hypothetical protein